MAQFGHHHHFMKRRLKTPGVYSSTNPIANWYRAWKDNRSADWDWPGGQWHLIVTRWFVQVYLLVVFCRFYGKLKSHYR
eukprot:UN02208